MSRIGKKPIIIPSGVTIELKGGFVVVKGAKGELKRLVPSNVAVKIENGVINVEIIGTDKKAKAMWGTMRALIANMITGVTSGFEKKLELVGVGYKAALSGKKLVLSLGYSHTIDVMAPEGIDFKVEKNIITISGIDNELIGQVAADIRSNREPEPYKGKGIRYVGEVVRRKAGKKSTGSGF